MYLSGTPTFVLRDRYTEKALADYDVEENYMNGWITLFQVGKVNLLNHRLPTHTHRHMQATHHDTAQHNATQHNIGVFYCSPTAAYAGA